jgi:hypothetical protein
MAVWNSCRLSDELLSVSAVAKSKPWIELASVRLTLPSSSLSAVSKDICAVRVSSFELADGLWLVADGLWLDGLGD